MATKLNPTAIVDKSITPAKLAPSVIAKLESNAGKTLTLGATNLAKLTDEQKAVATNKGWTLA